MERNSFATQNEVIKAIKREGKFDGYRRQILDKLVKNDGYVKRTIDSVDKGADEVIQKRMRHLPPRLGETDVKDELRSSVKHYVNQQAKDQQLALDVLSQIFKSTVYHSMEKEIRQRMYAAYGLQMEEEKEDEEAVEAAAVERCTTEATAMSPIN